MPQAPEIRAFLCRNDNIGILMRDPETGACAAIDVPEAAPVLTALDETGWRLTDILVTHRHCDHIAGIPEVKWRTGARVIAPAKAGAAVPEVDRAVAEGDRVEIGALNGLVWETPGHCSDHVTYVFEEPALTFAGDTLFTLGCGRVLEDDAATLWRSLQRFLALPGDMQVYSGHDYVLDNARFALAAEPGNAALEERRMQAEALAAQRRFLIPTSIAAERATNPFLRVSEPQLAASVGLPAGSDPAQVFSALRAWKNRF